MSAVSSDPREAFALSAQRAIAAARDFPLADACRLQRNDLPEGMLRDIWDGTCADGISVANPAYDEVAQCGVDRGSPQMRAWNLLTSWRIGRSHKQRRTDLQWLFDKLQQPARVCALCGGADYFLPTLCSGMVMADKTTLEPGPSWPERAATDTVSFREQLLSEIINEGTPCILKPANGACGEHIQSLQGAEEIDDAIAMATEVAHAPLDITEPWFISQVPRAVLVHKKDGVEFKMMYRHHTRRRTK